jgi:uncharacterized protein YjbI with pentapeptide repeats
VGWNLSRVNFEGADLRDADFRKADLREAKLDGADLRAADLSGADLTEADLCDTCLVGARFIGAWLDRALFNRALITDVSFAKASLRLTEFVRARFLPPLRFEGAKLWRTNLRRANLKKAIFRKAKLIRAKLVDADLTEADLREADLRGACLEGARLIGSVLEGAKLAGASIYGSSVWKVRCPPSVPAGLIVTRVGDDNKITTDNIEVAQYISLLLDNDRIRWAMDAVAKKIVLILGRFIKGRKAILEAIREKLRTYNYVSVIFDFEKPESYDLMETMSALAHMSRFVIADFTEPSMVLQEVPHVVANLKLPVVPLFCRDFGEPPDVLLGLERGGLVLKTFYYKNEEHLLGSLRAEVVDQAESAWRRLDHSGSGIEQLARRRRAVATLLTA